MRTSGARLAGAGLLVGMAVTMAVAGGPTTTTTTTATSTSTTTTTLLGGCEATPTFASLLCRIDALIAVVQGASDLGRLKPGILGSAQKARKQCAKAESAGTGKVASNQLKKCAKTLDTFRHKLDSNNAKKLIPAETRDFLRGEAQKIHGDVNTLRGTL